MLRSLLQRRLKGPHHRLRPIAIILHIPKTAGTTFRTAALQNYRPGQVFLHYPNSKPHNKLEDFWLLQNEALENLGLLMGHFGIEGADFAPRPAQIVTMIREPIARTVSRYQHAMSHSPGWKDKSDKPALSVFINRARSSQFDNAQTRLLSGLSGWAGKCDEAMLEAAIENVEKRIAFVGLTERFDESLKLIGNLLEWQHVQYQSLNRGPTERAPLSATDREALEEATRFDQRLYAYVAQRFDSRRPTIGVNVLRAGNARGETVSARLESVARLESTGAFRHSVEPAEHSSEPRFSIAAHSDVGLTLRFRPAAFKHADQVECFVGTERLAVGKLTEIADSNDPWVNWSLPLPSLTQRPCRIDLVLRQEDGRVIDVHSLTLEESTPGQAGVSSQ